MNEPTTPNCAESSDKQPASGDRRPADGSEARYRDALERIAVLNTGTIYDIDTAQEWALKALGYEPPKQVGFCELCDEMIRECDDYLADEDGMMGHKTCTQNA